MSTPEATIVAPDASGTTESSTPAVTDSSSVGTPPSAQDTASSATAGAVQETQSTTTQETDPLEGVPSIEELQVAAERDTPYAKSLIQLRNALEPLKTQYSELQEKWKTFEPVADKFTAPEELQSLVEMRESLLGWEQDDKGQLIPATQRFVNQLDPARQSYVFADLADVMVTDAQGQSIRRIDQVIERMGKNPEERANIARTLGLVEPSAVAPQWQATPEQLSVVREDLQDTFKKLPYDEREQLSTNEPDFINSYLQKQKLQDDLIAEREQRVTEDANRQREYQQQLQAEAQAAGEAYVDKLISDGLTTFHNSVVEQCNFIEPLDMAQLPEGMTADQANALNSQIAAANKAEAAQITAQVVALINPQTRRYMLPTLKEIGVVDDKFMAALDAAAEAVGNNGRNYGHLLHARSRTQRDYTPGPDVTPLNNEAQRNFKLLVHYANQLKGRLMEKRSQFFAMKATGHNNTLNGAATSRPNANGGPYDPTTARTQQPTGWLSRDEIANQFATR